MAILNIQLNAVSVVNLVMAVGIAVEFCVHLTHAFLVRAFCSLIPILYSCLVCFSLFFCLLVSSGYHKRIVEGDYLLIAKICVTAKL